MSQDSLFETAASLPPVAPGVIGAPLAARMRPRTLDEYVGNTKVIGAGTVLRRALDADRIPSLILWGPPGSGKTTLATLIASHTKSTFEALSAVSAGVADLRAVVARARERQRTGATTVLFIDEIHRFNKGQQDAVLPHVESGLIRLLGATTENPSHEVNAALLSRARVVRLEAHGDAELRTLVSRAMADSERGLGGHDLTLEEVAERRLVEGAGGDARIALDALELAAMAAGERDGRPAVIDVADIEGALQEPALLFDKGGDQHVWLISALIKSVRGSDPDAAVYWLARLLESGEDPRFVARRLILLAAEDVGLAEPRALDMTVAAQRAVEFIGMPEGYLPLVETTLYLAVCPKSNSAYRAYHAAREDVRATLHLPVPLHLRNAATSLDRAQGFGTDYVNSHDDPGTHQEFLPENLRGRRYYTPTDNGIEARIGARLAERRNSDEA